jgi:cell division protein FtsZ
LIPNTVEEQATDVSPKNLFETLAVVKVVGVGGAGGNAVNRMVQAGVEGVEFVAVNTDRQALDESRAGVRIGLGEHVTRGLGAGGDPEKGLAAAKESERAIVEALAGADMVFVAAGMGGGTGTGAAPLVARLASQLGALTVAVVTKPFAFEGSRRKLIAERGVEAVHGAADTVITVPNDNLAAAAGGSMTLQDSFRLADEVLRQGVQGISDIILRPGTVNVDFADVKSVLRGAGRAMMGVGRAEGDDRARRAAVAAASSPMLDGPIQGARKLLVNFTAGEDFALGEIHDAMGYLLQLADAEDAEITVGQVLDPAMEGIVEVTVLAAQFEPAAREFAPEAFYADRGEPRRAEVVETGRGAVVAPLEEIDLDIPAFLRQQRTRA